MALSLVSGPAVEPVSLAEARAHLRVDVSDEDSEITALITAAREWVETATHRALITQTWDLKRDEFPNGDLTLPFPPVTSVSSITYVDTSGTTQTWSSSLYLTDLPSGPHAAPARIAPIFGTPWPIARIVMNSVTVRFVAGYGATAETVPDGLKAAMKMMIAHWYGNRAPFLVSESRATVADIPLSVEALIWPFKAFT